MRRRTPPAARNGYSSITNWDLTGNLPNITLAAGTSSGTAAGAAAPV
jgi:hypothetical protein